MIKNNNITKFEKKIISKKNRFIFLKKDLLEIKKIISKKNILILGAAGSIGASFSLYLIEHFSSFNKIFLLDKNENDLTDLNRAIVSHNKNIDVDYICSDLNEINLDNFLSKKKINILLNFAAVKHVRSEENIESIHYMIKTNSLNFLPNKKNFLEKIFSISTDKTVNPQSILGISKDLMEKKLLEFSKKNNIFVSSARFANVSFSNGSILKYAYESLLANNRFGIPLKIRRFFITHEEAVHLCFKSILERNNKMIVVPSPKILKKDFLLKYLVSEIAKNLKKRIRYVNKFKKNSYKKLNEILLTKPNTHGQKIFEELFDKREVIVIDEDKTIVKVEMRLHRIDINKFMQRIFKISNVHFLKKEVRKVYKKYSIKKRLSFLSKTI
tara:strand:+ start:112 stop:1266 length:1155 start_codon:yes stop_codon:yes gene_type:complete